MKVTYITWDGPAQDYLGSLFFPLFAKTGLTFSVLQFTWGNVEQCLRNQKLALELGIHYESVNVLRTPLIPATGAMIVYGAYRLRRHVRKFGSEVLMPRSVIPAAICLMAQKNLPKTALVFDTDGLMADERVEFASWDSLGLTYRILRQIELRALHQADRVITRTHNASRILVDRMGPGSEAKYSVVTNGKDAELFCPMDPKDRIAVRARWGIPDDAIWVVYAGSLGPQYEPEKMLELFRHLLGQGVNAFLTILTGNIEVAARVFPQDEPRISFRRVVPEEVPLVLGSADLGLALRHPSFSQQAVCPIKIAEYLLCGLPIIATAGVGDTDILNDANVGIFTNRDPDWAAVSGIYLNQVMPFRDEFRARCRAVGLTHFDLAVSARETANLIQDLYS